MINFVLIAVCLVSGMLFRRLGSLPDNAHKGINAWIIYLGLPAVSFKYLPHIHWNINLLVPAITPVMVWLAAWIFIKTYASVNDINKTTEGGLRLSAGLSNTSFMGFPLIAAYFNEKDISIAIICDQVTFILLSTAGIVIAISASGKHVLSAGTVIRKVLRFPPFLACITALILPHLVSIIPLVPLFDKLAATVAPLALFSIGLQLTFNGWRRELNNLSAALFCKLIFAPMLVTVIVILFKIKGPAAHVSIFEAAMPTLLTSAVVAEEYSLNPHLSNLVIGTGIILSFASTALWWLVINQLT